jgi:hypothetical protein
MSTSPQRSIPRCRGEPVGDLGLHHHQALLERGQQAEHVQQHGHRDVVGQVRDQRGRCRTRHRGDPHRVAEDDLEAVHLAGSVRRDRGGQPGRQQLVQLDRHDAVGDAQQGQRERAQARADLDDDVIGSDPRLAHDPTHGVGVDHEVLSTLLRGPQVELGRK